MNRPVAVSIVKEPAGPQSFPTSQDRIDWSKSSVVTVKKPSIFKKIRDVLRAR